MIILPWTWLLLFFFGWSFWSCRTYCDWFTFTSNNRFQLISSWPRIKSSHSFVECLFISVGSSNNGSWIISPCQFEISFIWARSRIFSHSFTMWFVFIMTLSFVFSKRNWARNLWEKSFILIFTRPRSFSMSNTTFASASHPI